MEGKGSFSLFHHIPFIHNQILLHPSQLYRSFILIHSEELNRIEFDALLAGRIPKTIPTQAEKMILPIATDMETTGGPSRAPAAAVAIRALTP